MNNTERVIFNTSVLYGRLVIVMVVGLFSTRLVLDSLGETNYGIYTLVGGVVGMLAILQSAMSTTSMRYMAHSLGAGDEELISKTFNTTLCLHIIIGVVVVLFIEAGGYFLFKYFLNIPDDKIFEAKIIFHLMALTTFVAIIAVPYDAVINAHENLLALSLVDIIGAALKLGLAIYLSYSSLNLLIIYGLGMFFVEIIMRFIKQQYSLKHYKECRLNFKTAIDIKLFKEIMAFSGWNLLGSVAAMVVTQLRSVLLNIFFGVSINASEGVAKQGSNQVNTVSVNLTRAINPLLIKAEGRGERKKMLEITRMSTKFSVFLFALFAVPVMIGLPFLFNIWLNKVPEYAVVFTRLILLGFLADKFTFEIGSALRAVGQIREFQVTETIIVLLSLPVVYYMFKSGSPPKMIYIIGLLFSLITSAFRLFYAKKIIGLKVTQFFKQAILPTALPLIMASITGFIFIHFMDEGLRRFIVSTISSFVVLMLSIRYVALTSYELNKINSAFASFKHKFNMKI